MFRPERTVVIEDGMRSAAGMKSDPSTFVTWLDEGKHVVFTAPPFHEGSGSSAARTRRWIRTAQKTINIVSRDILTVSSSAYRLGSRLLSAGEKA